MTEFAGIEFAPLILLAIVGLALVMFFDIKDRLRADDVRVRRMRWAHNALASAEGVGKTLKDLESLADDISLARADFTICCGGQLQQSQADGPSALNRVDESLAQEDEAWLRGFFKL